MLTKSNNAQEEKVATPDLAQKAKGWCNTTRGSLLRTLKKKEGLGMGMWAERSLGGPSCSKKLNQLHLPTREWTTN